jgi:hypothetical protein
MINERIKEEVLIVEEKFKGNYEEMEKKSKLVEKRLEALKFDLDSSKFDQEELNRKIGQFEGKLEGIDRKIDDADKTDEILSLKANLKSVSKCMEDNNNLVKSVHEDMNGLQLQLQQKIDNLEKYISTVREEKKPEGLPLTGPAMSQSSLEAIDQLLKQNHHTCYKVETLKYDFELVKDDIVRQKMAQRVYNDKIDKLEQHALFAQLNSSKQINPQASMTNFMGNSSRITTGSNKGHDEEKRSDNEFRPILTQANPVPLSQYVAEIQKQPYNISRKKPENGIFPSNNFTPKLDDSFEKEFDSNRESIRGGNRIDFGGNLSIIDNGEQSMILDDFNNYDTRRSVTLGDVLGDFKRTETLPLNPIHEEKGEDNSFSQVNSNSTKPTTEANAEAPLTDDQRPTQFNAVNQSMSLMNNSVRISKGMLRKLDSNLQAPVDTPHEENKHDDSSIVELNIDDNGFLIDADGFPILNDKGEPMKLTEENIEFLKENGLYEEVEDEN